MDRYINIPIYDFIGYQQREYKLYIMYSRMLLESIW